MFEIPAGPYLLNDHPILVISLNFNLIALADCKPLNNDRRDRYHQGIPLVDHPAMDLLSADDSFHRASPSDGR
jgi:hypothetical protein